MKALRIVVAVLLAATCAVGLGACSEAVAAVVNGEKIYEQQVTDRIMTIRNSENTNYKEDKAWATVLKQSGHTPETFRKQVIENFEQDILIRQAAKERGISIDEAAVTEDVEKAKTTVGGDEATWLAALKRAGYNDEATLRTRLEVANLSEQLSEALGAEVDEEKLNEFIQQNASLLKSRRSSAIVLSSGDGTTLDEQKAKADEAYAKLQAGEDFAALVAEYSTDEESKAADGDMGWSALKQLSQEYTAALELLAEGQVSEPVSDTTSVYIIKCTGIFDPEPTAEASPPAEEPAAEPDAADTEQSTEPEGDEAAETEAAADDTETASTIDVSTIPTELLDAITEQFKQNNSQSAFSELLQKMKDEAEVTINDMPADVPYNVDMTLADDVSSSTTEEETTPEPQQTMPAIDPSEITGSLVVVDVVEGSGDEAKVGDSITVYYTGYLTDGTVFDSTDSSGQPVTFTLQSGDGGVIQGWVDGLAGMKVGGRRHIVIPPDMGYGSREMGSIPANSTLAFEVELLAVSGG